MNLRPGELQVRCAQALHRHVEIGDETTLHGAYEFGRAALDEGLGVLDMTLLLWRTVRDLPDAPESDSRTQRIEGFLLECLSTFEMAHRGAREANEALRKLDQRREEQTHRIARELHDQAGQLLASVYFSLDALRPHLAPGGEERLSRVRALLNQVEDEIRRVAHELRPVILDDLGLLPALRLLGEGVAHRTGLAIRVTGSTDGRLPPRIETELYRTAQEAFSNIARHAEAAHAHIEVRRNDREVQFRIRDDGRGFDAAVTNAPLAPRGLGLDGIRERLAPLGGALEIRSRPGVGTELLIHVPLEVSHDHAHSHRG
jgi:signal transduction histidine kinase